MIATCITRGIVTVSNVVTVFSDQQHLSEGRSPHSISLLLLVHSSSSPTYINRDMDSKAMPPPPLPRQTGVSASANARPTPSAREEEIVLPSLPAPPAQILTSEANVAAWPRTPGYRGYVGWLKKRCESIRGRTLVEGNAGTSPVSLFLLN